MDVIGEDICSDLEYFINAFADDFLSNAVE